MHDGFLLFRDLLKFLGCVLILKSSHYELNESSLNNSDSRKNELACILAWWFSGTLHFCVVHMYPLILFITLEKKLFFVITKITFSLSLCLIKFIPGLYRKLCDFFGKDIRYAGLLMMVLYNFLKLFLKIVMQLPPLNLYPIIMSTYSYFLHYAVALLYDGSPCMCFTNHQNHFIFLIDDRRDEWISRNTEKCLVSLPYYDPRIFSNHISYGILDYANSFY